MEVTRRDLLKLFAIAGGLGFADPDALWAAPAPEQLLSFEPLGNVTLLHMTDSHATLLPVYYREPDTLLGVGPERGRPPYLTGEAFLGHYGIKRGSAEAYALTHVDFAELARRYGRMGGYAAHRHAGQARAGRASRAARCCSTAATRCRARRPRCGPMARTWCRRSTSSASTCSRPHWEFTYGIDRVKQVFGDKDVRGTFKGEFVAQNVVDISWGPPGEPVFHSYVVRELGGVRLGILGQAFPYTPISHPRSFVPDLSFGIRDEQCRSTSTSCAGKHKVDAVVLLSHNGVAVDLKLAGRVKGVDVILGGHTHDGIPRPIKVGNTLVINSGAHGKFLSRLDLDVREGRVIDYRYKLIPVLSQPHPEDAEMEALIRDMRAPYEAKLAEKLAVTDSLLYRRGNFNGNFDEVVLEALLKHYDAQVAFSPGFRWGTSVLPGRGDHARGRLQPHRAVLSEHVGARDDRCRDQDHHGGRRRQPLQPGPVLPAGRRHGAGRRPHVHDRRRPRPGGAGLDMRIGGQPMHAETGATRRPAGPA
jgi:S-sulfosulfanyl-L-cysteine sulfohydrolase